MKLLVLAQTPPPLHGQSQMVATLLKGLPSHDIEVVHVQMRLSRNNSEIGRWRFGKIFTALRAAISARRTANRENCDALYYIPAPAKRGALYRDIAVMAICRDRRRKLVLHWHAPGMGAWFTRGMMPLERWLALRALGNADLSIVLGSELETDARVFEPRQLSIVANGLQDPGEQPERSRIKPFNVLFLGLCSREKGLFDAIDAIGILNSRTAGAFRLTIAGSFPSKAVYKSFKRRIASMGPELQYLGFADEKKKAELFREADLFCLPTYYPSEGQPLALIEALSYDLPIVTSRWRAIPEMMPTKNVWYVKASDALGLAHAIEAAKTAPKPGGATRQHFLCNFTREKHLESISAALNLLKV
jgi:glycosyltransferase involved in cell wall biosynthesis